MTHALRVILDVEFDGETHLHLWPKSGQVQVKNIQFLNFLTRVLIGLWIFHHLMKGGVENPLSNSAPRRRSEKPENVFESSSEVITKEFGPNFSLRSILR